MQEGRNISQPPYPACYLMVIYVSKRRHITGFVQIPETLNSLVSQSQLNSYKETSDARFGEREDKKKEPAMINSLVCSIS